jgi:hypothetical protein
MAQWRAQRVAAFNPKTVTAAEKNNAKCIQLIERELTTNEEALAEASALIIL